MANFKLMPWKIDRRVSQTENQKILDFQEKLLQTATKTDPECPQAMFNYLLLLWKQGRLFDLEVCY